MSSLALHVLTLTLGLFFILVGQFKVTPKLFPDIHQDMKHEFGRVNKVFPFYKMTGWRPFAKNYRMTVGITEIVCGIILILLPGRLKQLANVVLLAIMLGAVYTHYALGDKLDRIAPGIIFGLLLFTRLIIHQQGKRSSLNVKNEPMVVEAKDQTKSNRQESVDLKPKEKKKSNDKKKN
ncbi:unnamed protein product [Rotaria socialis]|uniref:Novel acetylcholine receptor chaperone n=1 Tax=Rotaria socialis TaxID=392032 RepID=A0A820TTU9_9BILA|nr:unnamed protein product [Rotaria socialis]CAF4472192.1 unnamed protein product [Rotaria socialis]